VKNILLKNNWLALLVATLLSGLLALMILLISSAPTATVSPAHYDSQFTITLDSGHHVTCWRGGGVTTHETLYGVSCDWDHPHE
jgi:hypothetical protein